MEKLSLKIYYFDKDSFLESYNRWKEGKSIPGMYIISPLEQSWNHFFKHQYKECLILDKFELKTVSDKVFNVHSVYVLEDDFLWLESIPSYENGKYININTDRLYSICYLKEASETYKNIFKDEYKNNFGEDWLNKVFTILNRQNKLKELGI
jgi:hypothetical protein